MATESGTDTVSNGAWARARRSSIALDKAPNAACVPSSKTSPASVRDKNFFHQRPTKARLQILYLVAYGGRGNAELYGGTAEIFAPRGRLKRPQSIQRR
tara:strand:- start:3580 stop:3876 length:297 start_codon:yes stop_codon:yes gene_type:complete